MLSSVQKDPKSNLFISIFSKDESSLVIKDVVVHEILPSSIRTDGNDIYHVNNVKTEMCVTIPSDPEFMIASLLRDKVKLAHNVLNVKIVPAYVSELNILTGNLESQEVGNEKMFNLQGDLHNDVYIKLKVSKEVSTLSAFRNIFSSYGETNGDILKCLDYFEIVPYDITHNMFYVVMKLNLEKGEQNG